LDGKPAIATWANKFYICASDQIYMLYLIAVSPEGCLPGSVYSLGYVRQDRVVVVDDIPPFLVTPASITLSPTP